MPSVVHLSSSDVQGGAPRAAFRLHLGLRAAGGDSKMLVDCLSSLFGQLEPHGPSCFLLSNRGPIQAGGDVVDTDGRHIAPTQLPPLFAALG